MLSRFLPIVCRGPIFDVMFRTAASFATMVTIMGSTIRRLLLPNLHRQHRHIMPNLLPQRHQHRHIMPNLLPQHRQHRRIMPSQFLHLHLHRRW